MSKIYKNPNGDVIISLSKEENKTLTNAMKKAVEELGLMKNGEVMTDTDRQYADEALVGLSVIHDYYANKTVADIAKQYSEPAVYHKGSKEYEELNAMPQPLWNAFLDELARYSVMCAYNHVYDTFTIG